MNARTRKVFDEALELPPDERGELAQRLLESLASGAADEIEDAWAPMIVRRAREVLDGTAPTRDLDETLHAIEERARSAVR